MIKKSIASGLLLLALGSAASAEPSVYGGFGGGSAQTAKNSKQIYALRQQVNRLQEEVDGLRSVIEGLSQQINQLRQQQRAASAGVRAEDLARLQRRIDALEKRPIPQKASSKRISTQKKPAGNSSYKSEGSKKTASKTAAGGGKKSALQKAESKALFSRGVRLINRKRYADALKRFEILKERNYKPASTHFYLGEIAYRTGKYDDAIRYYQKSAELNENAAYMDRLLLHTGIALEKSGDKEQARSFFQAIVDGYPGTGSAAVAKKHLR
ncbi:tetratricopeptide repeat protein [Nitratifractor sp.]